MVKDPRPAAFEILVRIERLMRFESLDLARLQIRSDERDIVERSIEVISEASRRLPEAFKAANPRIDWRALADIGNIIRHGYDVVSAPLLMDIVRLHLAPLEAAVSEFLAQLGDE